MGTEFVPRAVRERQDASRPLEVEALPPQRRVPPRSPSSDAGPVPVGSLEAASLPCVGEGPTRIRPAVDPSASERATGSSGDSRHASPAAATTRIGRLGSGSSTTVVRREIGTVPAPYRPLQKGDRPAPAAARPAPPLGPSTSLEDFAADAEVSYTRYIDDDDVMLDLLLGPFEANWFKAKACLTMGQWPPQCTRTPPHDVGVRLMHAMVRMRKAKWTEFVNTVVKPQFRERMAMFGAINGPLTDHPKTPPARAKGDARTPVDHAPARVPVSNPASLGIDLQSDLDAQARKDAGGDGKNLQNIFASVGAEAVTSDVDLASGGSNSELGVQFVNSRFRTHFKPGRVIPYDPGTVFDINLYASDWIHGDIETGRTPVAGGDKVTLTPRPEVPGMTAADKAARDRRMEVWSLVKVRRNLTDEEWTSYVTTITDSLEGDDREAMEEKLAEADHEYQKFTRSVAARQAQMMASIDAQEKAFFGARPSAFGAAHEHFADDAHTTRASNAIYEEHLQTVKELRLRIQKLQAAPVRNDAVISALGVALANKIAEALTYANEVYATEGAVQHTVLKQGAGKKARDLGVKEVDYALGPELYVQSVNENVGDALHSLHHFEDVPPYAVYRAGKYLARLCDAAELLLGRHANDLPGYRSIKEIARNSVTLKKRTTVLVDERTRMFGVPARIAPGLQEKEPNRYYDVEGDPDFVRKDPFFGDLQPADAAQVRSVIIAFGAAVPSVLAQKRAEEEQAARALQAARQQAASGAEGPAGQAASSS